MGKGRVVEMTSDKWPGDTLGRTYLAEVGSLKLIHKRKGKPLEILSRRNTLFFGFKKHHQLSKDQTKQREETVTHLKIVKVDVT